MSSGEPWWLVVPFAIALVGLAAFAVAALVGFVGAIAVDVFCHFESQGWC